MLPLLPRILPLLIALASAVATAARAQTPDSSGVVRGTAVADSAPLAFALVRLIPATPGRGRITLTREDGSFRFTRVGAGRYRLRLERIGFETELSEPFTVAPGDTVGYAFRSAPRPVVIEGVAAAPACYTGDQLERDRELASLWREAQKGMETKRAFDDEYVYAWDLVQRVESRLRTARRRGGDLLVDTLTEVIVNDPRRPRERQFGWEEGNLLWLRLPDGAEILDPDFLTTHCLDSGFEAAGDAWELDFRPVRPNPRRIEVRGTVRVDRRTFQLHSLRLEYVRGATAFISATIEYHDAAVPGGTLRLPVLATLSGTPVGRVARSIRHVEARVEYRNYRYVQQPVER